MKQFLRKFFGIKEPQNHARDFAAALQSRLTSDWLAGTQTADTEIRHALKTMRDRSRDLERNNDWARGYFSLLENNVIGATGIGLQMKIWEVYQNKRQHDKRAQDIVENGFWKWGKPQYCTVAGSMSFPTVCKLVLRAAARDGNAIVRKHYPQDNPFRFSLELIESDQLDTDQNGSYNGNQVRLGKEYDAYGKCVAYHLLSAHPGDSLGAARNAPFRVRVPASEIIHVYKPERIGQGVGFPWLASSVMPLRMLEKYSESEAIAARVSAAKMGWLIPSKDGPQGYTGASSTGSSEVQPGVMELLPPGFDVKFFDPNHPNSGFDSFVKSQLRQIASGLRVSYNSLANDLEGVNYSSIRAGLLEEREQWKAVQAWFIESFVQPVFEEWLMQSLLAKALTDGVVTLPAAKFDKYNQPEWKPRRWAWVDPLKDLQASVLAVEKGFNSQRAIIAENGGDIEDTYADIKADQDLAEANGLDFSPDSGQQANAQSDKPDSPDDASVDNKQKVTA